MQQKEQNIEKKINIIFDLKYQYTSIYTREEIILAKGKEITDESLKKLKTEPKYIQDILSKPIQILQSLFNIKNQNIKTEEDNKNLVFIIQLLNTYISKYKENTVCFLKEIEVNEQSIENIEKDLIKIQEYFLKYLNDFNNKILDQEAKNLEETENKILEIVKNICQKLNFTYIEENNTKDNNIEIFHQLNNCYFQLYSTLRSLLKNLIYKNQNIFNNCSIEQKNDQIIIDDDNFRSFFEFENIYLLPLIKQIDNQKIQCNNNINQLSFSELNELIEVLQIKNNFLQSFYDSEIFLNKSDFVQYFPTFYFKDREKLQNLLNIVFDDLFENAKNLLQIQNDKNLFSIYNTMINITENLRFITDIVKKMENLTNGNKDPYNPFSSK